ncbi:hypothetical protein M422DRAFT_22703 [Sphaerobolus stellatus SS14]|nr:hypothetical protein M422DRAFT_22703 [Sphaerobolus stellatus SS14]
MTTEVSNTAAMRKVLCSLGMFIIDEFEYRDADNNLLEHQKAPQVGGGGTYAAIGARTFLPARDIGMIVDKGPDFPEDILKQLLSYGEEMWFFREQETGQTTRALNKYVGEHRGFEYLTHRIRITPKDLEWSTSNFCKPSHLHFICSPSRAAEILGEVGEIDQWNPVTIYEPIPDRCVFEELPTLKRILPAISVLSPNAEEALSLLGANKDVSLESVEWACREFLAFGVGKDGEGSIVIRSGSLGACIANRSQPIRWVDAFWQQDNIDKIADVTGAGNAFLGGLSAGLHFTKDIYEAAFYASVAASFAIEQFGLPRLHGGKWNGDDPRKRLEELHARHRALNDSK